MKRGLLLAVGLIALALGLIGLVLPLLPTTPFVLLAAACFAKANPVWEQWLLDHPRLGPNLRRWRERGAIARPAKRLALGLLLSSALLGAWMLRERGAWAVLPPLACATVGLWIATRPEA